ncbi:MAG: hypothetical protein M3068_14860, partial [Gemmatimonadota bacterium]|nr:hypothetical protein [Gemmatimonadota bacterium]
ARRENTAPLLSEMRGVARRLEGMGDALLCALRPSPDAAPSVRWIELRGADHNVAATSVPLDVAPILREDLFKRLETGVITSATLAANGDFDFLKNRLGLDDPLLDPTEGIFPSPFRFERQAILALPTDVPAPNVDAPGHLRMVIRVALELADLSDGGLFLLFTSHRDVRAAAGELRARASERLWPLLVHGEDSRDGLLRRFRDSGRAILVGTSSFWEGVDVAGQALRALVLARIPFRVPSDPLTAAHCEAILENGGDAFTEFMLPHAALRLKQGFGRLIRSGTDRGVVVICDPRASTKPYGRELIDALPPARRLQGSWERMLPELKRFYVAHPS